MASARDLYGCDNCGKTPAYKAASSDWKPDYRRLCLKCCDRLAGGYQPVMYARVAIEGGKAATTRGRHAA